jgi:hypothetical protein
MTRAWLWNAKILAGLFAAAVVGLPQSYTISARPGAVNYVEGNVTIDGQAIGGSSLKSTFLNAGGLLETTDGKAEVLLTPGVFLRVGDHSRVRMLKPSLIDTQLAVEAGESMVEVDQFVKDSHIVISMQGGLTELEKNGLYRFMADGAASVSVIEGKAEVRFGEKHTGLGKGREVLLNDSLKAEEFDKNREDELFAWSNIRSQYNASLTYQAAQSAYSSGTGGYGNSYGGYGYGGYYGQGWFWNSGFNSWLWMPGGAFYSPFGWGFYGPGYVYGAPVVYVPVGGGGVTTVGGKPVKPPIHPVPTLTAARAASYAVPVDPKHMPAVGTTVASPAGFETARMQTSRSVAASGGLRTAGGAPVSRSGFAGGSYAGGGGRSASSGGSVSHSSGGGGMSSGGGGGGHASGGGGGGGGGHK